MQGGSEHQSTNLKRKREEEDDGNSRRKAVAKAMAEIIPESDWSLEFAENHQLFYNKQPLHTLLSLPREKWPFFMEYQSFFAKVAELHFQKFAKLKVEEADQIIGEVVSSGDRGVTYLPNKKPDESYMEYVIGNRDMLLE